MRNLDITRQYKKDLKRAFRQGRDTDALDAIILLLLNDETIPQKHRDHELSGNWKGHREVHVEFDWLLIYKKPDLETLILVRLGTHSELFG